jgi:hypothetical protein
MAAALTGRAVIEFGDARSMYLATPLLASCRPHSGGSSLYTKLTLMPRRARTKRGM